MCLLKVNDAKYHKVYQTNLLNQCFNHQGYNECNKFMGHIYDKNNQFWLQGCNKTVLQTFTSLLPGARFVNTS